KRSGRRVEEEMAAEERVKGRREQSEGKMVDVDRRDVEKRERGGGKGRGELKVGVNVGEGESEEEERGGGGGGGGGVFF
ncbi:hypothetical protein, partial [Burkholderia sp. Ac-20392]|uniref:hypothetical protein n=1 Tax=Burkholderia sp. Ac-20392 TaxID=2703905 RepID=UPI00198149F4